MERVTQEALKRTAQRLHAELVDFNRVVRLLSKGYVHGFGEMDDIYHRSIISADDEGVIHLDLRQFRELDFENQEALLADEEQHIPGPMIWE